MLFTRPEFFWLFLITFVAFYLPGGVWRRQQTAVLLLASFVFYGWNSPRLLLLLALSILINAVASFEVARSSRVAQKWWATSGVVANLFILGSFKYGALLTRLGIQIFHVQPGSVVGLLLTLPLPIGISFYTFEGISLLVDVFKGRVRPLDAGRTRHHSFATHLKNTSLFVAFFPHLIAGPILKAKHFYPQIGPKRFAEIRWNIAVKSLITGYFLKMVIADNLKDYTFKLAFPNCLRLGTINGSVLLFGYSIQIFADFAGYSLIAIGLAALLGYELPQNFNFPYISKSIAEFWTRWHISLSTWLRDYLYIPLGGNRKGRARTYWNLMIVMALGGLWHGAAWSFMIWGCYHGLGLATERFVRHAFEERLKRRRALHGLTVAALGGMRILAVFCFVTLGWLLFKLTDYRHAFAFMRMLVTKTHVKASIEETTAVALYSIPVIFYHALNLPSSQRLIAQWRTRFERRITWLEDFALGGMSAALLLNSGSTDEFIYFQF